GLGRGVVVERHRRLDSGVPPKPERGFHHVANLRHGRGVWTVLRFADDQEPVEQLQALTVEHAEVDEAVVLHAAPAASLHRLLGQQRHGRYGSERRRHRQCPRSDTLDIMAYQFATYEKKDRIGIVTVNRPERMNALHPPANLELHEIWNEF